ncbi:SpaA isopeptide-forming pilin-related protein [uncultured Anaerococcus sp.]|uniref:MSCRAMM family protein n=1 Tax=uncultured Anaerococcus sp. TaxID=293428 RepID=UPI0025DA66E0|nr:SpaA isopeptide-forming pilin-related protein [uncultured Anaerococcus sp.]
MGKIIKNKILGLILPLMMVLTIFIPSLKSFATSTEAKPKVQAVSNKYRVELNISHVDDRKTETEDIKANGRQVKYFKLPESYEKKYLIETAKRLHKLPMAEVEKELKSEGTLSNKSLIYDDGKLVETLSKDKFDKEKTFEKIVLENLEPGFYLIKETDESKEKYDQKLITVIEEVSEKTTTDGFMIVDMKNTVLNPSVILKKVDEDDESLYLERAKFRLYRRDGDKSIPVAVKGENGFYKYDATSTNESDLETWSDGTITVEGLPKEGTYYFVEVAPPVGYDNKDNKGKISDDFKPSPTLEIKVKNKRYPLLKKVDDESKALNDVKFKLFKKDGSPVKVKANAKGQLTYVEKDGDDVITTTGKGTIFIEKLPDGEYYFQEIETLKGYQADTKKKYEFSYAKGKMTTPDKKPYLIIVNKKIPVKGGETPKPKETPKGGYKFVKTDNTSKAKRLGGAVFQVQKIVNGKYETIQRNGKNYQVISDEKGEFSVSDLEYGDYALREIKAPSGYNPESAPIKFTIKAGSDSLPAIFIENKEVPPGTPPPPEKPPVPPTPEKPNTVIKTEKPNTIVKTDKPINTVKTDYTPSTQTTVSKIIRGPLVKTGDIRIIIMAVIGLILLIVGVKLVRSAEKPRIA